VGVARKTKDMKMGDIQEKHVVEKVKFIREISEVECIFNENAGYRK